MRHANLVCPRSPRQGDISKWNTKSLYASSMMFDGCTGFNADISKWPLDAIAGVETMRLQNTGLSACNKRRIYDTWRSSWPRLKDGIEKTYGFFKDGSCVVSGGSHGIVRETPWKYMPGFSSGPRVRPF